MRIANDTRIYLHNTSKHFKKRKGKLQITQKTQFAAAILLRHTTSSQDSFEKINHTCHNLILNT